MSAYPYVSMRPPLASRMMMESVCHPPTSLDLSLSCSRSPSIQIKCALLAKQRHFHANLTHTNSSIIRTLKRISTMFYAVGLLLKACHTVSDVTLSTQCSGGELGCYSL